MANGHGGARIGAGRKPNTARARWLGGNAGKRPIAIVSPPRDAATSGSSPIDPPGDLDADARRYWEKWARLAEARGLLVEATRPGFEILCETAAKADRFWADIVARGFVLDGEEDPDARAHPLIAPWARLLARQEQLLARFGLVADGKIHGGRVEPDAEARELARILRVN